MKKIALLLIVILQISFLPPKKKWIAIGDSITYLNDHLNETGNRVTSGYMTRVQKKLPWLDFENQGHNGWTSGQIASEFDKLGIGKADIYTVFLGTNDWWRGRTLGTMTDYEKNTGNNTVFGSFRIIIDKLRKLNKDARIILLTPMQRVDFVYINDMKNNAFGSYRDKNAQSLASFAAAIRLIGDHEHFTVLDLHNNKKMSYEHLVKYKLLKDSASGEYKKYRYPDFIDRPFDPAKDEYPYPTGAIDVTYDGLHPSDKGYQIISKMLIKALKRG